MLKAILLFIFFQFSYSDPLPLRSEAGPSFDCKNCAETISARNIGDISKINEKLDDKVNKCEHISVLTKKCYLNTDGTRSDAFTNMANTCQLNGAIGIIKGLYDTIKGITVDLPALALSGVDASIGSNMSSRIEKKVSALEDETSRKIAIGIKKTQIAYMDSKIGKAVISQHPRILRALGESDSTISEHMKMISNLKNENLAEIQKLARKEKIGDLSQKTETTSDENLVIAITSSIADAATNNFGCIKWKAGHVPNLPGSICEKKWDSISCSDCKTISNVICGSSGYVYGSLGFSTVVLGKVLKYLNKGAVATENAAVRVGDKVQNKVSTLAPEKVPKSDQVSMTEVVFDKIKDQVKSGVDNLKNSSGVLVDSVQQAMAKIGADKVVKSTVVVEAVRSQYQKVSRYLEVKFVDAYKGKEAASKVIQSQAKSDVEKAKIKINELQSRLVTDESKMTKQQAKLSYWQLEKAQQELYQKQSKLVDIVVVSEKASLESRPQLLFDSLMKSELEKPSWSMLDEAGKAKRKAQILAESEADFAKNFSVAVDQFQFVEKNAALTSGQVVDQFAEVCHEAWRTGKRIKQDPKAFTEAWLAKMESDIDKLSPPVRNLVRKYKDNASKGQYLEYEPRIFPTTHRVDVDKISIGVNGKYPDVVDISNTKFDELPSFWKADNLKQSENIQFVKSTYPDLEKSLNQSKIYQVVKDIPVSDPNRYDKIYKEIKKLYPNGLPSNDPMARIAIFEHANFIERSGASAGDLVALGSSSSLVTDQNEKKIKERTGEKPKE